MMCVFVFGTFPPLGGTEMVTTEPFQPPPFSFEEVAVYFTEVEWTLLDAEQRDLYWDVMQENYETVASLAVAIPKPELIYHLERGEEPWISAQAASEEKKIPLNLYEAGGAIESGTPEAESLHAASALSKPGSGAKPSPEICGLRQGSGRQPPRWPVKTESELLPGGNDVTDISQIKIVQIEKKHVCHDCGKAFQYKFELVKHRRTHTGEKPFECLACGKRFFQSTHLNAHLRIHTGEKPYECSRCGRSFNRRSTLTEHLRIHTGEKPYKCLQCGESFRWRPYLTKHQRVHLGENTYRYFDSGGSLYGTSSFPERHQEESQPEYLTATPDLISQQDPWWLQQSEERESRGRQCRGKGQRGPSWILSEGESEGRVSPTPPPYNGAGPRDACGNVTAEDLAENQPQSDLEIVSDVVSRSSDRDASRQAGIVSKSRNA